MAAVRGWIFTIYFILTANAVWGHIPYYYSAEPDAPIYVSGVPGVKLSSETAADRLRAVRAVMEAMRVDAYIVPTADAHNSQYISPADARREWLSGLRGSSGTALVTATEALVWTDARYWTQFEEEVDGTLWKLMKQGVDASLQQWLVSNMRPNSVVAVDPTTYTRRAWTSLDNDLSAAGVDLLAIYDNLVDEARRQLSDGPPQRSNDPLIPLPIEYTGERASSKISELVSQMQQKNADMLLLTALDDIAYTLNLRGTDIPYNPVFFSYLLIRRHPNIGSTVAEIVLFWGDGVLPENIRNHLTVEGVPVLCIPYEEIFDYLRSVSSGIGAQSTIWLSNEASHAIWLAIESGGSAHVYSTSISPVALKKCVKNDVELEGFRLAHIKDGVAVVRALHWLETQVNSGVNVTEMDLSNKLVEFRSLEDNFRGPSFSTIAGAGSNGAIIHYSPQITGPQRIIRPEDMLLVDSGGQYFEGTTDITRTRHMSASPTPAQRLTFTRVLKGQINLATTIVPKGTLGNVIEVLARKYLWDVGLNYGHGTGHGVGHYLNVHEGPIWILSGRMDDDPGIAPKMIYSNEPGYYEVGEYGIRHEDLVETIEITKESDHILASGVVGDFDGRGAVGFRTISLAPHQVACLDVDLLTDFEIKYLNDYHERVFKTLGPILQQRGLTDVYVWLEKECAPIKRDDKSSAILVKSTPILAAISAIVIWLGY
ncbi:xaa-Pro aminopeptidase ApepP-like [Spodoptera frugiperda]|uniref:Xaa-Pro aminopeptidase ApepP-like n=1 Tax=Spodoptera frugiperda TaxID=7108 RepID=A0A9R0E153_SPOFR|nr:xaa-Pro aminopeptidase ApepP-like [Spodoptera frugiperda]